MNLTRLTRKLLPAGIAITALSGAGDAPICTIGPQSATYAASQDQSPTPDALELARDMNGALAPACTPNCPKIALLRNPTAGGLLLIPNGAQQWKLVYSPKFLSEIDDTYGDAAVVAMISHEFGHALDVTMASAWPKELPAEARADAWAGCSLAQTQASPADLKSALAAFAKYPASGYTQAQWSGRLQSLRLGYTKCAGDPTKFDAK
jgi:hypothetical protein